MASKTAILSVRILTDTVSAVKGLDNYGGAIGRLERDLSKLTAPAAIALTAIGLLSAKAISAASEAQQAAGAVEAIFGVYADKVKAQAAAAAENVGLAESQYSQLAAVLGAQLKNLGTPMDQIADKAGGLITLGADLAAQFGGKTADAVNALSSLLRGERDPIERYGVTIKQATIDAKKAELGLDGLSGAADTNADSIATLQLLYEQTASAAGTFASEADTAAGASQIAAAQFDNAAAKLGESLLPYVVQAAGALEDLSKWIEDNSAQFRIIVGIIAAVAAIILVLKVAVEAYTIAQGIANIVMAANPIGLVIVAIALLIALIIVIVANWEQLGKIFGEVIDNIVEWWNDLVESFQHGFDQIIGWITEVIDWFAQLFGAQAAASSGGAGRAVMRLGYVYPAPAGYSVPAGAPPTLGIAPFSAPAPRADPAPAININVTGAIDPDATARQIRRIITRYGRKQGTIYAGGSSWR